MQLRTLKEVERVLMQKLAHLAETIVDWEQLRAASMDDGGMGSIELYPDGAPAIERTFGRVVAELEVFDTDAIPVIVSLHVDSTGALYEMEIWKADGSPVKELRLD